jgi:hypothetical protein
MEFSVRMPSSRWIENGKWKEEKSEAEYHGNVYGDRQSQHQAYDKPIKPALQI